MADAAAAGARFRVAEALAGDAGRGWARLDGDDLRRLGAAPGDVLLVEGARATVARAAEAPPSHCGRGLVLVDGDTRGNAQAGVDDTVTVRKVPHRRADSLLLAPVQVGLPPPSEAEVPALVQLLAGRAVVLGDHVQVTFLGERPRAFTVEGAVPRGALVVAPDTDVAFKPADASEERAYRVSYEDIGGLAREVALVREMVELPLRCPELFAALGIDPPRGVLLSGPPGTGKTLIARAVSNEVRAHFVHVNGPEVIHKYYGESEAKLRAVFDEARRNAPAIVFLDEIDALAPRRAQVVGDVEKRVVAQLLALMDGLVERGAVVVIGATNLPEMVDPALRRPGRFDREIAIGVPDRAARREILGICARRMPLARDVDLDRVADITHGYVGADLAAVCKEAGMAALRRLLPRLRLDAEGPARLAGAAIDVTDGDFLEAYRAVEPTATRELLAERPRTRLADVGGLAEVKRALRAAVGLVRDGGGPRLRGFHPPKGILLTGASGTGKTLLARALAGELGMTLLTVDLTALLSRWVGESEKGLREVFKRAKQTSPSVLFFDELEALAPRRSAQDAGSLAPRLVSQLVRELDDLCGSLGVAVIGATNRPDLVDPAVLRPGRLDYAVELPLPDELDRLDILTLLARELPLAGDVDLGDVVEQTAGWSGAELALLVKRAAILALDGGRAGAALTVTASHLEEARGAVRSPAGGVAAWSRAGAARRAAVERA